MQNGPIDLAPGSTLGGQPLGGATGTGGAGTVLYTHCPWVGSHGKDSVHANRRLSLGLGRPCGGQSNGPFHRDGCVFGDHGFSFTTTHGTQSAAATTPRHGRCSRPGVPAGSHGKALSTATHPRVRRNGPIWESRDTGCMAREPPGHLQGLWIPRLQRRMGPRSAPASARGGYIRASWPALPKVPISPLWARFSPSR